MADFGSRNSGFFGGTSSGGGGGTSTGVNGLNGTTNIGLGGTLTLAQTIINGNFTNVLYFGQQGSVFFETSINTFILTTGASFTNGSDISSNQDGVHLFSYLSSNSNLRTDFFQSYVEIFTKFNNTKFGLQLNFTDKKFTLGDYADAFTKTKLVVDELNGWVYTDFFTTSQCGIFLTETNATFSAFDGTTKISLNIAGSTKEINATYGGGQVNGLSLNFDTFVYKFGGFDVASFDNYIQITDDGVGLQEILFSTQALNFNGANLISGSSGGNSGDHLVITLNGQPYKIVLHNP